MKMLRSWLTLIIGILLILPLIGVNQLGTPTSGIMGWLIALAVLVIGIMKLMKK